MSTPVQQLGPAVLVQGPAVDDTRRILAQALRWARRDGIAPSPRIGELIAALEAASAAGHASSQVNGDRGHADAAASTCVPASAHAHDYIGVADASEILDLGRRQVRRLGRTLDGWKSPSGAWMFSRADVEAYRNHRNRNDTQERVK